MKRGFIIFILFLLVGSVKTFAQTGQELMDVCMAMSGDAKYLKDFNIKLDAGDPAPVFRQSTVLNKNTIYKFSVCNSKDFPGEAILEVYDNNRLVLTSHMLATGEDFPTISFKCTKTQVYHFWVKFKNGKEGLAVVLLSYAGKF